MTQERTRIIPTYNGKTITSFVEYDDGYSTWYRITFTDGCEADIYGEQTYEGNRSVYVMHVISGGI